MDAAALERIDEVLEVDPLGGVLVGVNDNVALVVDAEVALAPVAHTIGFVGLRQAPALADAGEVGGFGGAPLQKFAHQNWPRPGAAGVGGVGVRKSRWYHKRLSQPRNNDFAQSPPPDDR